MPKVYITKPISVNLTADSKDTVHLVPGLQDVSQEVADHWFVQAHCQDLSELTDDTATNEVIAQMEAQLASTQSELEVANKLATDNAALAGTARANLVKVETELAAKTKALADANGKLQKSQTDNKAKDDRIAALEKELAAAKAKSVPATDKPA